MLSELLIIPLDKPPIYYQNVAFVKVNEQQHNLGIGLSDGWYIVNYNSSNYSTSCLCRRR
jgi:hypothetical protein